MNRRSVLASLGLGALALSAPSLIATPVAAQPVESEVGSAVAVNPETVVYRRGSTLFRLPKSRQRRMAWTIDDGTSVAMLRKYLALVESENVRLTFFVYSSMSGWKTLAPQLRPLIASGQIQVGNHTAHHLDLTKLSTKQIQKELWTCHLFMLNNYGVDARPFFRPPYGAINSKVVKAAAAIGYTSPVMWSGTVADSTAISVAGIWRKAKRYVGNEVILLTHANNTQASKVFGKMLNLVSQRGLQLVTLNDAFAKSPAVPSQVNSQVQDQSIVVTWSQVTNAQTYDVFYVESGVQQTQRATGTQFVFSSAQPLVDYQFQVRANVFGVASARSDLTPPVHVTPPP